MEWEKPFTWKHLSDHQPAHSYPKEWWVQTWAHPVLTTDRHCDLAAYLFRMFRLESFPSEDWTTGGIWMVPCHHQLSELIKPYSYLTRSSVELSLETDWTDLAGTASSCRDWPEKQALSVLNHELSSQHLSPIKDRIFCNCWYSQSPL